MNVLTLRNGKVLEDTTKPKGSSAVNNEVIEIEDESKVMEEIVVEETQANKKEASLTPSRVYVPPVPFPQRLAKAKLEQKHGKFLEILKGKHFNIPFLDEISEIPSYGKFLKELLLSKKKLGARASVSLMPLSILKKLEMMDLNPTRVSLQLADRSVKFPLGVVEDVPLATGKLVIPCDFFVMDIPEDTQVPIILGRPCLATVGAMIDVKSGKLFLQVGEDKVKFELSKTMSGPSMGDSCYRVDVLEEYLSEASIQPTSSDLLQDCLTNSDSDDIEILAYMLGSLIPPHLTLLSLHLRLCWYLV
ncbi:uncharacterized protein LOC141630141 [Silene latifolia]|uniref:uncharacterized protein LOC141630141 n=1 Tax=Silene latifolia TaxID=37657 RepID=UPI003D77DC66